MPTSDITAITATSRVMVFVIDVIVKLISFSTASWQPVPRATTSATKAILMITLSMVSKERTRWMVRDFTDMNGASPMRQTSDPALQG